MARMLLISFIQIQHEINKDMNVRIIKMSLNIFYEFQELRKLPEASFDWKKKTIAKILNNILCVHPVKMLGYNILKSVAFYMNLKKPTWKILVSLFSRSYRSIKQCQSFCPFPVCCIKLTRTFNAWKSSFFPCQGSGKIVTGKLYFPYFIIRYTFSIMNVLL